MTKKLFVFDLDFTLWDAAGTWCDCTVPPYTRENHAVKEGAGGHIVLYPDVIGVLELLKQENCLIASASRTSAPGVAAQLLELFDIRHYFDFEQIYPSSKLLHFKKLKEVSGLSYCDMVFFDDEDRNIIEVTGLGVACQLVHDGISLEMIKRYL